MTPTALVKSQPDITQIKDRQREMAHRSRWRLPI